MLEIFTNLDPYALEMAGVAGFGLYVTNYTLLTFHRLHSHDALYFGINLVAASLVLLSLTASFNLASAMIQIFWVFISSTAIILRLRRKGTTGPDKTVKSETLQEPVFRHARQA